MVRLKLSQKKNNSSDCKKTLNGVKLVESLQDAACENMDDIFMQWHTCEFMLMLYAHWMNEAIFISIKNSPFGLPITLYRIK